MIPRIHGSRQIAERVTQWAVQYLSDRVDTSAFTPGDLGLVAHNTLPVRRRGWCTVSIERADIEPATHMLLSDLEVETPFQVRHSVRAGLARLSGVRARRRIPGPALRNAHRNPWRRCALDS
jgi:hypothetical protein